MTPEEYETLNIKIKECYKLAELKAEIEEKIEKLKGDIASIEETIAPLKEYILNVLKETKMYEYEIDGLFANSYQREEIGYSSDADVIKYLEENGYNQFVKVKVTKSLDKNPLKKEIKNNQKLQEALDGFLVKKLTEYVTVTDTENHQKMLEHIEEKKK